MNIRDRVRRNIRDLREQKGMTQIEMAEKLSISPAAYAKWERGEIQIRLDRLPHIAQILEVSEEELLHNNFDGVVVFNNSNDSVNNSSHVNVSVGNPALESELAQLRLMIEYKDALFNAKEREVELLNKQVESLQKIIDTLERG